MTLRSRRHLPPNTSLQSRLSSVECRTHVSANLQSNPPKTNLKLNCLSSKRTSSQSTHARRPTHQPPNRKVVRIRCGRCVAVCLCVSPETQHFRCVHSAQARKYYMYMYMLCVYVRLHTIVYIEYEQHNFMLNHPSRWAQMMMGKTLRTARVNMCVYFLFSCVISKRTRRQHILTHTDTYGAHLRNTYYILPNIILYMIEHLFILNTIVSVQQQTTTNWINPHSVCVYVRLCACRLLVFECV